jgi:hypothetical protein
MAAAGPRWPPARGRARLSCRRGAGCSRSLAEASPQNAAAGSAHSEVANSGLPVEEEVSSNLSVPGALMPFYPVMPPDATPGCAEDAALGLLGQAGMVAVRVADLACPARRGLGKDGRTALTAAGAGRIRSGDLVVWLKPVAVARAVVRRDGRVQAAGHPADHASLGVAEERLSCAGYGA